MKTAGELIEKAGYNPDIGIGAIINSIAMQHAAQCLTAQSQAHDQDMIDFAEWMGSKFERLHFVWVSKYLNQSEKSNWKETPELLAQFRNQNKEGEK